MLAPAKLNTPQTLGQVRTPRHLADWMTAWACAERPGRILEPAVGDGVFVEAIADLAGGTSWRPVVLAFDVDGDQISALRRGAFLSCDAVELKCRQKDFLSASIGHRFDCIVANPPYVRHHAMQCTDEVWRQFDDQCGVRLSRMTNLYGLFLLRIWTLLAPGGRAAIITPAEWMNADFGRQLKRYLLGENAIEGLVHFHPRSQVFSDALTTAVIILLRRGRGEADDVRLVGLGNSAELGAKTLRTGKLYPRSQLSPDEKWTPLFYSRGVRSSKQTRSLGEIAACRRGIATGANDFFTLRESERTKWGIARRDVTVCITRAAQGAAEELTRGDVRRWIEDDERIYLLKPVSRSAALERYLEHGRALGVDRRFLPSHRPIWYMPEAREPAPILISVFTRKNFRIIFNGPAVLNLTAYHGIYPRDTSPSAVRRLFDFLRSDRGARAISRQQRIYGGGLLKLEPRDVESVEIPRNLG